ncbi:uncharacterized protein LOC106012079 [Aplysia californica]|uniref:Uncharacterized protein LOC106012079 n=1 Tax=Aplysia californica TaxID=6500 RepID=A0ABM1A232_APLCA|nr:uncharacterized protein LOC106012079 [Aplysia californica]
MLFSVVGMVVNILVMAVFVRQRFGDNVTITLFSIAFWDFVVCLSLHMTTYVPLVRLYAPAAAHSFNSVATLVFRSLDTVGSVVSLCLAAFLGVSRCIFVTCPFRAKSLLTARRTVLLVVSISVLVFCWMISSFSTSTLVSVFSSQFNQSVLVIKTRPNTELETAYYAALIVCPNLSFFIIIISTIAISYALKKSVKFRANMVPNVSASSAKSHDVISTKERKITKMLVVVMAVYMILFLIPHWTMGIAVGLEPKLYPFEAYHNLLHAVTMFIQVFCVINNCCINFFVYLKMSSAFRATFMRMVFKVRPQGRNCVVKQHTLNCQENHG